MHEWGGNEEVDTTEGAYTINDFRRLKRGEKITIYRTDNEFPRVQWTHDRIAYDSIWGVIETPGGVSLPVNPYLYDAGPAVRFGGGPGCRSPDRSQWIGFPGGFKLANGFASYAYRRPPLLSQYPRKWDPSQIKLAREASFSRSDPELHAAVSRARLRD